MLYLLGSIILASYLTLSFKACERFGIDKFQAIVFNYVACVATGSIFAGEFPVSADLPAQSWFPWALLMGAYFIGSFNLTAFSVQRIGVSVVTVALKLSLVIPFLFSIYFYHEPFTSLKITGVILALISVVFTCYPQNRIIDRNRQRENLLLLAILPVILFISSGILDTLIKYVEQNSLNSENKNSYLITCFIVAGSIGLLILAARLISGNLKFQPKALVAGILIGIPNYFSIWCLVKVLKEHQNQSSSIIPINNLGIVLFSTVVAWLLFKERLTTTNWAGIIIALVAIGLMAF